MRIAIAGAGIGGLAAACLLATNGHQIDLFDQFAAPRPIGSGLMIQPMGLHVLDLCGAGDSVRANGQTIARMLGHDGARRILDVRYDPAGRIPRQGTAIHRATLHAALLNATLAHGVTITPAMSVQSAPLHGNQRHLHMTNGTTHGPYDLVIDATGAGSTLSPLKAHALPYGAIWGTVPWPETTDLPQNQLTQAYHRASRMAGVLPLGRVPNRHGPHAAIFWSMPRETLAHWPQTALEDWKAQATTHWPALTPFLETLTHTDQMTTATYTHGTLKRPYAPALAFIGDAAHRASPQLGQGANMALFDALALARALHQNPLDDALPRYAQTRRWHVRLYQTLSAVFTPQYQSNSRILPALRDHILAPASLTWPMPRVLSRIVAGTLIPPLAGEPAPQIHLGLNT
ncbi:2-polyprenyl-6-methoxyphenol hydroxylase [Pseudorhodobacter antarcticus]|uniref:2-polyprenyl-6-methoxyphenol hydroxylase n=1 Tax=Pseudorhodobacter antarcticus TaxID=1077947 RepID=A0A1H8IY81_9RHOB|nr:NAD(P)/FAD-dependent oxidoreductase [Pseudorhodobacter antarcticus]SEN72638.1 2-polyprenyl-6-methoxyphenol hydroxylase [Pseudorhodobacter antarcticus]